MQIFYLIFNVALCEQLHRKHCNSFALSACLAITMLPVPLISMVLFTFSDAKYRMHTVKLA